GVYQIATGRETFVSGGETFTLPDEDFTAARVRRRLLEQSAIGAIYTRRATSPDADGIAPEDRHTAGVDLDLSTRNFLGNNNAQLEAFMVWNSNPDPSAERSFEDPSAHGARLAFPNPVWSGHISYRQFGSAYDPSVGFVNRRNFRRVEPRIQYTLRPEGISWIRQMDWSAQFR